MADVTLTLPESAVDHLRAVMLTEIGTDPNCVECAKIIRALPNRDGACECRGETMSISQSGGERWRCDLCGGIVTEADDD